MQAVDAMRLGIMSVDPRAECVAVPMADGGEGTVDAVIDALDGQHVVVDVADALGRPISATFGYVPQRRLAVIEIAAAAGIELIAPDERDALGASTFGVGQLISSALDQGATEVLIGLGGSATNDGGAGALTALGVQFVDDCGNHLAPGGGALERLHRIDVSEIDPRLRNTRIRLACDVTAPLLGPTGASAVFGPQKGAAPADVARLESALTRLACVTSSTLGHAQPARAPAPAPQAGWGSRCSSFWAQNPNPECRSSPKRLVWKTPSRALIGCSPEKAVLTPKPCKARHHSVSRSSHAATRSLSSSSVVGSVPTPRSCTSTESTNSP